MTFIIVVFVSMWSCNARFTAIMLVREIAA